MADELERPPVLPIVLYVVVGTLAVIGAISIAGFVVGLAGTALRLAFIALIAFVVWKGLVAMMRSRKPRSADAA